MHLFSSDTPGAIPSIFECSTASKEAEKRKKCAHPRSKLMTHLDNRSPGFTVTVAGDGGAPGCHLTFREFAIFGASE
ncbi:hypothetical protein JTB14_017465 [Gonioctena quinquepunctata]|nr:hypothetical protein JTB14_017465 [Gonioctena quinquepunctata]